MQTQTYKLKPRRFTCAGGSLEESFSDYKQISIVNNICPKMSSESLCAGVRHDRLLHDCISHCATNSPWLLCR